MFRRVVIRAPAGFRLSGGELADEVHAGGFAAPTFLGADSAVLHTVLRMHLTFPRADAAGGRAGVERRPEQLIVAGGQASRDPAGGGADVGAIQIEPDATRQHLWFLLAEAGICARGTRLRAADAGADALGQCVGNGGLAWMGLQHLADGGHEFRSFPGGNRGDQIANRAGRQNR